MVSLRNRDEIKVPARYSGEHEELYGEASIVAGDRVSTESTPNTMGKTGNKKRRRPKKKASTPATESSAAEFTGLELDQSQIATPKSAPKPGLEGSTSAYDNVMKDFASLKMEEESTKAGMPGHGGLDGLPRFDKTRYLPLLKDIVISRLIKGETPKAEGFKSDTLPTGLTKVDPDLQISMISFTELHPTIQMCILYSIQDEAAAAWQADPKSGELVLSDKNKSKAVLWLPLVEGVTSLPGPARTNSPDTPTVSLPTSGRKRQAVELYKPGRPGAEYYPADRLLDMDHAYFDSLTVRQRAYINAPEKMYTDADIAMASAYLDRKQFPRRWLEGVWDDFD